MGATDRRLEVDELRPGEEVPRPDVVVRSRHGIRIHGVDHEIGVVRPGPQVLERDDDDAGRVQPLGVGRVGIEPIVDDDFGLEGDRRLDQVAAAGSDDLVVMRGKDLGREVTSVVDEEAHTMPHELVGDAQGVLDVPQADRRVAGDREEDVAMGELVLGERPVSSIVDVDRLAARDQDEVDQGPESAPGLEHPATAGDQPARLSIDRVEVLAVDPLAVQRHVRAVAPRPGQVGVIDRRLDRLDRGVGKEPVDHRIEGLGPDQRGRRLERHHDVVLPSEDAAISG